ncbi:uncharacterized protein PG986_010319 [Apiospora aurea]|uniref:Uncharacterized protein n=1 Tax=Apiospora aurea TaxID=335848 RepID=A0ABR1Q343_9PEZI
MRPRASADLDDELSTEAPTVNLTEGAPRKKRKGAPSQAFQTPTKPNNDTIIYHTTPYKLSAAASATRPIPLKRRPRGQRPDYTEPDSEDIPYITFDIHHNT